MNKFKAVRMGHFSTLIHQKVIFTIAVFFFLLLVVFLLSTGMGETFFNPWIVAKTVLGYGDSFHELVINSFRLPRIVMALLVGMSLGVAGAILQGLVRNPLAAPDMMGITGGASVGVVLFLSLFSNKSNSLTVSIEWMPVSAFLGALLVTLILYMLSWKKGVSPLTLVLVGVGLWAITKAFTTLFMILGPIYQASQANIWITGTVYGANWRNIAVLAPITFVLLIISFVLSRIINIHELGEDLAQNAGSKVQKHRLLLLILCTGLVGSAVAFAGGIGFVGLMAPHIARRLVGSSFGALLPLTALIGALLVIIADTIGRTAFLPVEVPAGVFTAAIGAPYFIFLLFRSKK
ncbi:FecCD family ABC transporter permease [Priestia koreensis]|uniref:FecCD family ABC transporter permease n=1 Tax=Priestia koreensis TaxID=284581 RepID=UPI00203ACD25|nr:iron ABC transporter permease [Priestia koreensis]MCM3004480.1 iron ABC transporter permease [Priestia koreensis]